MKPMTADHVWDFLQRGGSARLPENAPAKYSVGDTVVAKNLNPHGHIRLPRYVRGKRGRIVRDQGVFIFPDKHAERVKEPQRLYCVRFEGHELWGRDSKDAVLVDLFEDYLDPHES